MRHALGRIAMRETMPVRVCGVSLGQALVPRHSRQAVGMHGIAGGRKIGPMNLKGGGGGGGAVNGTRGAGTAMRTAGEFFRSLFSIHSLDCATQDLQEHVELLASELDWAMKLLVG